MTTLAEQLSPPPLDRPTAVYRFYDREGRLLYVGITFDLGARFASHARKASWWLDQHSVVALWRDTRTVAAAEERAAIRDERPLHNVAGTRAQRIRSKRRERRDEAMRKAIGLEVRVEVARAAKSKREVREYLGLSTQSLWQRMTGQVQFRESELNSLAELLGVPVSRFFPASVVAEDVAS